MAATHVTCAKVGIILINYQDYARRFLAHCRDSLRALDYPSDRYAVYLVDNETSPATQAFLRATYPEAVVIPEVTNAGWGGGNNRGIERALADSCDDVIFLNMDTIVDHGWLRELVAVAYGEVNTGIVQSKLLLHPIGSDGIPRVNSLGNVVHFLGFGYCDGYGSPDDPTDDRVRDIGYASGASMYVKGEVLRRVGHCNPEFFMYHDDLEICLKAKLAGYRVILAPRSICWHKYAFQRSMRQVYSMERNRLLTVLAFYRLPTLLVLAPAFLMMEIAVLVGGILGGYAGAKCRGWAYFLRPRTWGVLVRERRALRRIRTIRDRELLRDATGVIAFQEVLHPLLRYVGNPLMAAYWGVARQLIRW